MNILLLDDHTLFRESLRRLLEAERDWAVVGAFGLLEEALALLDGGLPVDVALVDFQLTGDHMPGPHGLEAVERMRALRPQLPMLIVTAGMNAPDLLYAIQKARVGIFLKSGSAEELFLALRQTAAGHLWVSSSVSLSLLQEDAQVAGAKEADFSPREKNVLLFALEGLSNKEIAGELAVSESTVKAIFQSLFSKTGVRNRSQLVRVALEKHYKNT